MAGVLLGFRAGDVVVAEELVIGENLSERDDRFYLDPAALLEAFKYAETSGYEVVALIHTHRRGTSPSPLDLEGMRLWPILWVIVDELECSADAWTIEEQAPRKVPIKLTSA